MVLTDPLANVLSHINTCAQLGRTDCLVPSSRFVREVLALLQRKGYLGEFKEVIHARGNYLQVSLVSTLNQCSVIKPRFNVTYNDYIKFEKRFLPAKEFGLLVVSTSEGLMTQAEAREKKLGGRLVAYCY